MKIGLGHIEIYCWDFESMCLFYEKLGLTMTSCGTFKKNNQEAVFMSGNPKSEQCHLVLMPGRISDITHLDHFALRVDSLDELRNLWKFLVENKVVPESDIEKANHGAWWSLYFHDPDGNRIEILTYSPFYVSQPTACGKKELSLDKTNKEIIELTKKQFEGYGLIYREE